MNARTTSTPVSRIRGNGWESGEDLIAREEPLEIRVAGVPLVITMRTPGDDVDLAIGFLFTEGLIQRAEDVLSASANDAGDSVGITLAPGVTLPVRDRVFAMTAACGVCGKTSLDTLRAQPSAPLAAPRTIISIATLHGLPARLRSAQATFAATGGLHAAGLFDANGALLIAREDVGRHNAVDKLIGARVRAGMPFAPDHLLLVSGRASFELVQKALMAHIPILAAVGAPSSAAVELAREAGMTLCGFVRDDRFNIYGAPERLS